ncbi:MAG TPA: D-alanyl-lipoteichoic acid biosynthesis protein DltD [Chthoniobacterales bacterium]
MPGAKPQTAKPHIFAGVIVIGLTVATLFAGRAVALQRERNAAPAFASELFPLKIQGLAFQRAAAQTPGILPVYGSSEMGGPPHWTAGDFFRNAPTGFQVSAVGKPGATTLILLQKIGALDRELRGKKVVVSFSSNWFLGSPNPNWYEGNFSRFAASQLIFDSALDFRLKHDIAARIVQYPQALERTPLLGFAVRCLASDRWLDQIAFWAASPLGKLEDVMWDLQDHFAVLSKLHEDKNPPPRRPQTMDWASLMVQAQEAAARDPRRDPSVGPPREHFNPGSRDAWFGGLMGKSEAWTDLELLLRILQEIHARPLLLAMPMNGPYWNPRGVSRQGRQPYYDRFRTLARRYHATLADFPDYDDDPDILNPHLTAKGWILFDRAIDDFMHDRIPEA